MSGQEQRAKQHRDRDTNDAGVPSTPPAEQERKAKLDDDVDAILADIDDVLEENAEEFVKGYRQKGGQ